MQLHEYQIRAANFMQAHKNCILSVDMGLGKTAAVLSYLNTAKPSTACIIAPKRVAETVWLQEAIKWGWLSLADKMIIVAGTPKKRAAALSDKTHPYKIVGRENVNALAGMIFDILVLDELTSFKNVEAARTKAVCRIIARQKIGLTGTFLANGAIDIYGQCAAVGIPQHYNFWAWRASFFKDQLAGSGLQFHKWVLRSTLAEVLQPVQDNIFTLTAADHLSIPPVSHFQHPVQLDNATMNAYKELDAFLGFNLNGEALTVEEGAKYAKLQTLCNGFVYDENGRAVRSERSAKLEDVADFVQQCKENGEPVLLFYAYREEAIWLQELLKARGVGCESVQKAGFLERWNNGQTDCLFAHPASAGHGLNLQHGGRIIVWSSLTYNYEFYAQANARLARQGQTKKVQIHYFTAANTCEAQVWRALQNKDKQQQEFLIRTKQ